MIREHLYTQYTRYSPAAGVNDGVNAYRYAFARRGPARLRGCARSCIVARRPAQGGATHTRSTGALRDSGARARRVPGACPPCSAATTAALIQRGPKKPRIPVFFVCVPVFLNRGVLEDLNRTHGQANRYRARKKFLKKPPPRDDDSGRLAAMKQPRGSETNHARHGRKRKVFWLRQPEPHPHLHYPVAASGRPPHTDAAALQCTALTAERFCTGSARTRGQPHGAFLRSVRPWGGEDGEP